MTGAKGIQVLIGGQYSELRIGQTGRLDIGPDLVKSSDTNQDPDVLVLWGCHECPQEVDHGLGLADPGVNTGQIVNGRGSFLGHADKTVHNIRQGLAQSRAWGVPVGLEEGP